MVTGPPLAFLRATLKSWERGPGDEASFKHVHLLTEKLHA